MLTLATFFPGARSQDPAKKTKGRNIRYWVTSPDQASLLQQQKTPLYFHPKQDTFPSIKVDSRQVYQSIDGFGFTLTGGSAGLINALAPKTKKELLRELFGKSGNSIGISYLRISIAASDLSATVFSYDDLPDGETDTLLARFSLSKDTTDLIPLLQEILSVDPGIKILATPWSPPVWMKDNNQSMGGHLLPQYYDAYARYIVKYIRAMQAKGITINAITPQNEPLNGNNNPSMVMTAEEQGAFIKNNLGPAFRQAGITTKIILYDHNCDRPDYPLSILKDPAANPFIDGSAFHLYAGDISAIAPIHDQFPDKHLYFTEQWTGSKGSFQGDLTWHTKNVIIGSMRNWCRVALEWNLANDPDFGPHTPGGCTECKGALTIGSTISRNVAYYIIAHASKFVPAGSRRIETNLVGKLPNVAFITPSKQKVLIVLNEGNAAIDFNIQEDQQVAKTRLPAGAVATYVW
ncbi:glycoside hydrolase family 30 protein [Flavihumibacter fluvii]|uniref:glycoside hydrolase family 30 protein n=1 Tax=Flavihumibacter fluvii TaxID=2838157 RepID=UPI001EFAC332|nr:glycoside hydrolase family 30 beta sandwich domain-containing protein [Flavihumibacter fluvii]ULQ52206.1 glucosylceramidase [Flavihumibacter fluvii]